MAHAQSPRTQARFRIGSVHGTSSVSHGDALHEYDPFMSTTHPQDIGKQERSLRETTALHPVSVDRQESSAEFTGYRDTSESYDENDASSSEDEDKVEQHEEEEAQFDDDGIPVLDNPSHDVKADLEAALMGRQPTNYHFANQHTYAHAPDPVITIQDNNPITLPLSEVEAIKMARKQHELAQENSWWNAEIRFGNPEWEWFMAKVAQEACRGLKVDYDDQVVELKLTGLRLFSKDDHILTGTSSGLPEGTFANILLILPSRFLVEPVHFLYRQQAQTLTINHDFAHTGVTLLSWFTDADPKDLKLPIVEGHALLLHYYLAHATTIPTPDTAAETEAADNLRHVLISWKQGSGGIDKLLYALDEPENHTPLSKHALSQRNADLITKLEQAADGLRFTFALGTLGYTHGLGQTSLQPFTRENNVFNEEDDSDAEYDLAVSEVVETDGKQLFKNIILDEEDLKNILPTGWRDKTAGAANQSDQVTKLPKLNQVVLIMWPHWARPAIAVGRDHAIEDAIEALRHANLDGPEERDLELLDYLLLGSHFTPHGIRMMCHAACVWNELSLWTEAAVHAHEFTIIGYPILAKALHAFGARPALSGIKQPLLWEKSRLQGREFLAGMIQWAQGLRDDLLRDEVVAFVEELLVSDELPKEDVPLP